MRWTPLPFGPSVASGELAPLGGAGATSSGSSKDPSRPLGGEKMRLMGLIWLMCLIGLMGSCTSELASPGSASEQEQQQELEPEQGLPLDVMSYVTEYKDYVMTRTEPAWVPAGFTTTPEHKAIGVFFTRDASGGNPASNEERRFWYNDNGTPTVTDDKWYISGKEMPQGDFYLYGFMPYNAADNVTVAPNATYAEGATLTFNGLGSVVTKDICVLIGAKDGSSPTDPTTYEVVTGLTVGASSVAGLYEFDTSTSQYISTSDATAQSGKTYYERKDLKIGQFASKMKASQNKLFMLFEHIYAKVDFCFRVDEEYAKLRTIKLKELTLMAYTYTIAQPTPVVMKKKGSIEVQLKANTTGASPIVNGIKGIVFNPDDTSGAMDPELLFEGEETLPSDKYPEGHPQSGEYKYTEETGFVPYFNFTDPTKKILYVLRSTYDVYDNNKTTEHPDGNLIRLNQQADNAIDPYNLFNESQLEAGKRYRIYLTVKPTYLYVMSEEDIDNPTVELN